MIGSNDEYQRTMGCYGKQRHKDYEDARQTAKRFRKRYGPKVKPYKCKFCEYYHLGHRTNQRRKQKRQQIFKTLGGNKE